MRLLLTGFSLGSGLAMAQSPAKPGTVREARADEIVPVSSIPSLASPTDPVARAASPDDTGYEQYRASNPAPQSPNGNSNNNAGNDSTMIGRAWTNVKKWVNDRGTNYSKSATDNAGVDNGLMPLSPATMPQFANGQNGQNGQNGPANPNSQYGQYGPANAQYGPNNRPPAGMNPNANPYQFNTQQAVQPYARSPQSAAPFGGGPVMAGPQGTGIPPTQLAGRPAYNWYGYGSAPPSGFPQASTNWMNQTGATPGAFPVTGQPVIPRPASIGGPRAVSTIPTIPSPTIPPPTIPTSQTNPVATTTAVPPGNLAITTTTGTPTNPEFKPVPTVTPPPVSNAAPFAPITTAPAAPPAAPRFEEPEWQPATASRVEQMSGTTSASGRVVHAAALGENETEPNWQTAKVVTPKLIPVPTQERAPAELPTPIPRVSMEIPVQAQIPAINPAPQSMTAPTASIPPSTTSSLSTSVTTQATPQYQPQTQAQPQPQPQTQTPTTYSVPLTPAATATQALATVNPGAMAATQVNSTAQSNAVNSAPWQPIATPIATNTARPTTGTMPSVSNGSTPNAQNYVNQTQPNAGQSTTGRVTNRSQTQQQLQQRTAMNTMPANPQANGGLAPPPPDAPIPQLIPVNASREILEIERQIRSASVRSATILEVSEVGPRKLVVKFVSKTEPAAQEAAQSISQLPILKPYAVDFEVRLANR
ncbi:MAG: hypothetical protein U0798_16300 [Gemmataceae bacterium]